MIYYKSKWLLGFIKLLFIYYLIIIGFYCYKINKNRLQKWEIEQVMQV